MAVRTCTARWVLPVEGPPLERGVVAVEGERIAAVEASGQADVDFGDAAILPGLVNAHVHLDLAGMRGLAVPAPGEPFPDWLRRVIAHRRTRSPEQVQADIRAGLAECVRTGTTLLGDISAGGASWDALACGPVRAIVFNEVLGMAPDRVEAAMKVLETWPYNRPDSEFARPGVSPHAPYSTHRAAIMLAAGINTPLTMHLAESAEEVELLEHRTGPFVQFLQDLNAWDPREMARGVANALDLLRISTRPILLAHGNYLPPDAQLSANTTIVYCPRTHAAFGHPPHPFRELLARGVRVALGTDGLSSNPDLDLLAEVRFLYGRFPDVPGETLLWMATLAGAEALGWADACGSLEPGKSADWVVVPLSGERDDPYRSWLGNAEPVREVWVRGRRV